MIIAIRIVLILIASWVIYLGMYVDCYNWLFPSTMYSSWDVPCTARFLAITISTPLTIAFVAGYVKKSQAVFWNTFVGILTIETWLIYVDKIY